MNYEEIKKIAKQLKGQPIFVESIKNNQLLDEYQRALQTLISAVDIIEELQAKLARVDDVRELSKFITKFIYNNDFFARDDLAKAIQKYIKGE